MDLGVDFANYTPVPTPLQLQCWWEQGVRFAIVGCQRAEPATAQLRALAADGRFGLEAYQYYYWDANDHDRTDRALTVKQAGCKRLWVDVEWNDADGAEPGPDRVVPGITAVVQHVESQGFEAGIYTSARFWPSMTGNTTAFSRLPLWHAAYSSRYTLQTAPDFVRDFAAYGGWTKPLIWQFAGSTPLCALNVDLNYSEAPVGHAASTGVTAAQPAGPGVMVRFNGQTLTDKAIRGRTILDLVQTVALPRTARMARLEISLAQPAYLGIGDGEGGAYAGSLRDGDRHLFVDVVPAGGKVTLDAPDGATFNYVGVVGYWT